MLEVDPQVIAPDELIARVRRRVAATEGGHALAAALSGPVAPNADLQQLEENVRQLHAGWYNAQETISSHRPGIGPFLVAGKKLVRNLLAWYVEKRWGQQVDFNGTVARAVADLLRLQRSTSGQLAGLQAELTREREAHAAAIEATSAELRDCLEALEGRIAGLSDAFAIARATAAEDARTRGELRQQIDTLRGENAHLAMRLRQQQRASDSTPAAMLASASAVPATPPATADAIDYVLFENRFRGSREAITEHMRPLLDWFEPCFLGRGRVIDLGCGRGEMLELLLAKGCDARGIDLDRDMVDFCLDRGLPVTYGDGLALLEAEADASLGGIFMSQVIEHLDAAQWTGFLATARRKLRANGCLVIETINPGSFYALAHAYYRDLTHVRPVHPETLQFVAETQGYRDVQLLWRSPHPLTADAGFLDLTTRALVNTVFGHLDYALVAHR